MSNVLIPINFDGEQPTVSARDLHTGLEIRTAFKDWFPRMTEYGFNAGVDFNPLTFEQVRIEGNREVKREITDYEISVDMAKQICMIQRSEKGRQYRQYFIDLEKAWNSTELVLARAVKLSDKKIAGLISDNKELREEIKFKDKQLMAQQEVISELQPKADYVDMILKCQSLVLTTQIAKDYGMSARAFNKLLHELGIQYKVGDQWVLYAKYQACGYVHSTTYEYTRRGGIVGVKMRTEWTQKGRLFLYETLKKEGYLPLIEAA